MAKFLAPDYRFKMFHIDNQTPKQVFWFYKVSDSFREVKRGNTD